MTDRDVNRARTRAPRLRPTRASAKKINYDEDDYDGLYKRPSAPPPNRSQHSHQGYGYNMPPLPNPLVGAGFGRRPATDDDEEFRLTMGDIASKKRSFGIFQDTSHVPPETSPARTESPLEEPRYAFYV